MDAVVLEHLLTEDEARTFDTDGYLLVREALDTTTVNRLLDAARLADREARTAQRLGSHQVVNLHDLIARDDAWLELVDCPTTFPKVWAILGWNIQLFHTQLIVTPPAPVGSGSGAYGWHQDNNRMNLDFETTVHPRVSVKVGYFLTDLPRPGMGNLAVVPGSHPRGRPDIPLGGQPDGAIELTAAAGDAVVFDRRLWHAASTNRSDTNRVFLTYGYSYRWLRPKSAMQHGELMERVDPIRRQLLGWCTTSNGYFEPTDDDVPLRTWLKSNIGEAAVAP